jgi:2-dehydro-3-deoxyphosphogluconate aldolase/(4S)-4-hydroxy-2-oxoglutarate aldolase
MTDQDRLAELKSAGVVAVLRAPSYETALKTIDALVEGGITAIEVTYSTPEAARVVREVVRSYGDGVYVGAGTIVTAEQAREISDAGARFLVSPGTIPELAGAMLDTGNVVMLGAMTPSEVMRAAALGAHAVKVFPASLGGPGYLSALRAPFPSIPFMPTGGVNASNIPDWFAAGAVAVGAGGDLCSSSAMAAGDWAAITATARIFADSLSRARAGV